jgi:hypothetical protein
MTARVEIPFVPRPTELRGAHVEPPWVPMHPRWVYKELVRDAESGELPTEAELNAFGAAGWELTGIVRAGHQVHFYFKREQAR